MTKIYYELAEMCRSLRLYSLYIYFAEKAYRADKLAKFWRK